MNRFGHKYDDSGKSRTQMKGMDVTESGRLDFNDSMQKKKRCIGRMRCQKLKEKLYNQFSESWELGKHWISWQQVLTGNLFRVSSLDKLVPTVFSFLCCSDPDLNLQERESDWPMEHKNFIKFLWEPQTL